MMPDRNGLMLLSSTVSVLEHFLRSRFSAAERGGSVDGLGRPPPPLRHRSPDCLYGADVKIVVWRVEAFVRMEVC